ncbi:YqeB family protein [Actinoplanes sp. CA-030573]|uniref:YqeB family protein n=1 Tax=Actinoplanes sp. CA-030573 TaxID=3239898 RepID=UPI003D8B3BF4
MLEQTTTVPTPWWARLLTWLGLPLAGAALLFLAVRVVWWLPLPGPLSLIRELPGTAATIAAAAAGALLGLVLAGLADRESLTVRITRADVMLTRPGSTVAVPRPDIAVAFPDRDRLVLLGRTGRELAREPSHLSARRLRAAFTGNGIAWADQDPYLASYRRWVPGLPELPETAHALLAARQKAIESGDENDQRDLRGELARLGYVIRDDRKRQHWRRADG